MGTDYEAVALLALLLAVTASGQPDSEYLGCYKDGFWSKQLVKRLWNIGHDNSPARCGAECRDAGYTFFGLQNRRECYCGNTLRTQNKAPREECNVKCSGDRSKICGGGFRQSLYKLENPKALQIATVEGAKYLGCYGDAWWSRQLEKRLYSSKNNSPEKCGDVCRDAGYTFFGLQTNVFDPKYSQCFCGNTLKSKHTRPEEECYSKCPDDPSQICGGNLRQTLYRFTILPTTTTENPITINAGKASPIPVVLWHGIAGDSRVGYVSRGKEALEKSIPGIYVKSLQIPEQKDDTTDKEQEFLETLASITYQINKQVEVACKQIASDPKLQNGYNAIGYSQGGLLMRGVAQRCPNPPMKKLITMGSPHQGVYGFAKQCVVLGQWVRFLLILLSGKSDATCKDNQPIINKKVYTQFWQTDFAPAQYWHNPLAPTEYAKESQFLADINMEGENPNQTYAINLKKLEKLVLVYYEKEDVVEPRESSEFKFYKDGSETEIVDFDHPSVTTGLKGTLQEMRANGKMVYVQNSHYHLGHSSQWFKKKIIIPYLKGNNTD